MYYIYYIIIVQIWATIKLLENSVTDLFIFFHIVKCTYHLRAGVAPGIFRREADSFDEGTKIWFSGYYICQKSPKKMTFHIPTGG